MTCLLKIQEKKLTICEINDTWKLELDLGREEFCGKLSTDFVLFNLPGVQEFFDSI